MTQEEKAIAYDEALRYAMIYYKEGNEDMKVMMKTCFPVLAEESKDERIRKFLIKWIQDNYYHGTTEIPTKTLISWLEKQGESSNQIHYWTEEEIEPIISDYLRGAEHYGGMIGRLRCLKPKSLEKQGEKSLTVDIDSMIEAYEQRLLSQGNTVKNSPIINMCVAAFKHGVENTLDELHLKQGETSQILSNSSNIGKIEQKPAWSEEDEKEYKYVLKFVDNILNNCGNKKDYEHCKRCYDWLKSLKYRYTWKPNEEQMSALWDKISNDNLPNSEKEISQQVALTELYEQLKKLKG